jgi:hypothetical protein
LIWRFTFLTSKRLKEPATITTMAVAVAAIAVLPPLPRCHCCRRRRRRHHLLSPSLFLSPLLSSSLSQSFLIVV